MDTVLSATPSSYWQIIGRSLKLYKMSFARVILLSFLLALIVFIPRFLSFVIGQDLFWNLAPLNWNRLWLIVIEIGSMIFFIGIVWRMHCVMIGKQEKLIEDFSVGTHKVIAVIIASILSSLIIFGIAAIIFGIQILLHESHLLFIHHLLGTLLTMLVFGASFIAILYCFTLFIFLVPLIAIENCNAFVALEKSVLLGWNHWWRIFSVQLTPWFAYLLLTLFLRFALKIDVHVYFIENNPHNLIASLLHMVLFALFIPWVAATLLVQIKDLETRNKLLKASK